MKPYSMGSSQAGSRAQRCALQSYVLAYLGAGRSRVGDDPLLKAGGRNGSETTADGMRPDTSAIPSQEEAKVCGRGGRTALRCAHAAGASPPSEQPAAPHPCTLCGSPGGSQTGNFPCALRPERGQPVVLFAHAPFLSHPQAAAGASPEPPLALLEVSVFLSSQTAADSLSPSPWYVERHGAQGHLHR